jgi:hypothetical protein
MVVVGKTKLTALITIPVKKRKKTITAFLSPP